MGYTPCKERRRATVRDSSFGRDVNELENVTVSVQMKTYGVYRRATVCCLSVVRQHFPILYVYTELYAYWRTYITNYLLILISRLAISWFVFSMISDSAANISFTNFLILYDRTLNEHPPYIVRP